MNAFTPFDEGKLILPERTVDFRELRWNRHPVFEGVELKHLVTGKDTDGRISYSLVRIAPGCSIGNHIHDPQMETHEVISGRGICINNGIELAYEPETISIIPARVPHEVHAGAEGLYLLAKFSPALT